MNITGNNALEKADNPKAMLALLNQSKSAIEMALPKHLNSERMIRLALTCFSTNQALRNCTPRSIIASVVVASQLGLEPGVAGQGYLIPYKQTCTFVPGWQGLVGLLNNTGRATAWTGAVFEGDEWVFELGSKPHCYHKPGPNYGDVDKMTWVYACGKVNGSEQPVVEAWPISRVKKHRDKYNKVGQAHYSFTNFEMYARKVVLLQVLKYMPRSIELNNAIVAANAAEDGRQVGVEAGTIIEIEPEAGDVQQSAQQEAPAQKTKAPANPAPVISKAKESPKQTSAPVTSAPQPAEAAPQQAPDPSPEPATPEPDQESNQVIENPEPPEDAGECVKMIESLCARDGVTTDQTLRFLYGAGMADAKKHKSISELATLKLQRIIVNWPNMVTNIKKIAA